MLAERKRRRALDSLPWPGNAAPQSRRACIEFVRAGKTDDRTTFPYSKLVWLNFYASYGILAHFSSHTVHVLGRKLEGVYHGLRNQTIDSIVPEAEQGEGTAGVESVHIKQVGKDAPGFVRLDADTLRREEA